jgi:hypothetical protein
MLLAWLAHRFHLPRFPRVGLEIVAVLLLIASWVLVKRARQEDWFLRKPEPERPPSWFFFCDGKPWWLKPLGAIVIIGADRLIPVFIKRKENQT